MSVISGYHGAYHHVAANRTGNTVPREHQSAVFFIVPTVKKEGF
jgi:hypothetical protein